MPSIDPKSLSANQLNNYLLSVVSPRPIALASTLDNEGTPNLAPFSFFNVVSINPPVLVFSVAQRFKSNVKKHTLANIELTKEVVINLVNHDMVQQMSFTSKIFDKTVNEFDKSGLTMMKSEVVKPFRVAESPVQFECKVNDIITFGDKGGSGSLIICEILKFHIDDEFLTEHAQIKQQQLDLVAKAGQSYYIRSKNGFFEMPDPTLTKGIGIDCFPEHVKNSMVLTGNDLGLLANVDKLPTKSEIKGFINNLSSRYPDIVNASHRKKHKLARNYLSFADVNSAWKILLS